MPIQRKPYRVLLVEDERAVCRTYSRLLRRSMITDEASSLAEARRLLSCPGRRGDPYAAVLLDLALPDGDGGDLVTECMALVPRPVCMVLSGNLDPTRVVGLGLRGVVPMPKSLVDSSLADAVTTLIEERLAPESSDPIAALTLLSSAQREILRLTIEGKTAKECADALHVGVRTVETHWERIFEKTGTRSKVQLLGALLRSDKV